MRVRMLSLKRSMDMDSDLLAFARIELSSDTEDSIVIDDARVIRSPEGDLRLALPPFVLSDDGCYTLLHLPTTLRSSIEVLVLKALSLREAP